MLSIGIVGLPNVGKSTLFQALTKKEVDRSNYPFATIDPNIGVVAVPDERLDKLAGLVGLAEKRYASIEFVDIAGLVRGAAKGEGLGNQFLARIREVDAIAFVLRAFKDSNVVHTEAGVDPLADKEILDLELGLKDLETILKRLDHLSGDLKAKKKEALEEEPVLAKAVKILEAGEKLGSRSWGRDELAILNRYQLLTLKRRLYVLNTDRDDRSAAAVCTLKKEGPVLAFNIADELGAAGLTAEERAELGLPPESALDILIKSAYTLLDLVTFFTLVGERQAQAWAAPRGSSVVEAAGRIHNDLAEHFVRAEVINWEKLLAAGPAAAREKGLVRTEGKNYIVQEGDVIEIKH